jgi:nucleotide-binding universal stress UspA family protein
MKKILVAIDGSECALKAVDYVGKQFSGVDDLTVTLLHVLPYPPAPLWDDGHIPTGEEKRERDNAIQKWLVNQRSKADGIFGKAVDILTRNGFSAHQIEKKTISDSTEVAGSILEETRDKGYQTLAVGRCGHSPAKQFIIGSVTMKILSHGAGVAICVVE